MSGLPSSNTLLRLHRERTATRAAVCKKPKKVQLPHNTFEIGLESEHCWNCSQNASPNKWRLPIRRKGSGKDLQYVCKGCFCSPNCAKRYALDRLGSRGVECCSMVSELLRRVDKNLRCEPAPPFMALKKYGGHLSLEDYHDTRCVVAPPHMLVEYLNLHI